MTARIPSPEAAHPGQSPRAGEPAPAAATAPAPIHEPESPSAVARCVLPTERRAASWARSFTEAQLASWQVGHGVTFAACTVVSELVTNTILHSGAPDVSLRLTRSGTQIRIETVDNGVWRDPVPPGDNDVAESGRGLLLVGALAQDHGVYQVPSGTCSWAVLSGTADEEG
ncbi:ATP-binding protein [Streptomyces sp. NPDC004647]|uniref:ATP-binding protein n=1 Tax=Streptomyces sp. NPDC004647 TaxID=3154671 RepID=UPI0033A86CD5